MRARRWRLGLLAVALLAVGGLGVARLVSSEVGSAAGARPQAVSAMSAGAIAADPQRSRASSAGAVATSAQAAGGKSATEADADSDGEDSVEICGYGRVTRSEVEAARRSGGASLSTLVSRVKSALEQRPDRARSQLAARLAVGGDAERVAGRLIMGDPEGAAAIAAQSRDAAAYRLGLSGCGGRFDGSPTCRGLSLQGWMERDPADARPWLSLAGQAVLRRDETAAGDALAEAVKRPKLSSSEPLLPVAMKVAPAVVTDRKELGLLSIELMGQQAAMNEWPSVVALSRYCSAAGLKDGQRLPLCRQLAVKLMDGADNLAEAQVAQKVADRAGVPAAERRFDATTLAAAQQRFMEYTTDRKSFGLDCASLGHIADYFFERAERGELQTALALLKRSGPSAAASTAVR